MATKLFKALKRQLFESWWVILFTLLCFFCYEQGVKMRNIQFQVLSKQLQEFQQEKQNALALQSELNAQIQSQEDTEWIELLLLRELGVVPEGQKKVFFTN